MSSKLTREAYERLIAEDVAWLTKQPRTLEREHILAILARSAGHEYDDALAAAEVALRCAQDDAHAWSLRAQEERQARERAEAALAQAEAQAAVMKKLADAYGAALELVRRACGGGSGDLSGIVECAEGTAKALRLANERAGFVQAALDAAARERENECKHGVMPDLVCHACDALKAERDALRARVAVLEEALRGTCVRSLDDGTHCWCDDDLSRRRATDEPHTSDLCIECRAALAGTGAGEVERDPDGGVPGPSYLCTCHEDCGQDSASGRLHQHEDEPCPLHPEREMIG